MKQFIKWYNFPVELVITLICLATHFESFATGYISHKEFDKFIEDMRPFTLLVSSLLYSWIIYLIVR